MVHVGMSQRSPKGAAHPVVAEDTLEEVFTPGTAAAGYLGRQIFGSTRGAAKNFAGARTWRGQVFLVHLVCLVYLVYLVYFVCLVGLVRRTKETKRTS